MKQYIIKFILINFFLRLIQCEINTTNNLFFPSIIIQSYQNLPLTEQAIYDLKNTMRKSNEIIDYDDEDDYNEDEQIDIDNQLITSIQTTTLIIEYIEEKSSSASILSCYLSMFIYLLIIIIIILN